jgi:4-hydroxythreonine-4-phosphate dehydrogenase
MANPDLPRLGISLGDPAGIGPEVVAKALADPAVRRLARFAVFGLARRAWADAAGLPLDFVSQVTGLDEWDGRAGDVALIVPPGIEGAEIPRGRPTAESGRAAVQFILAAVEAARAGRTDGIVTAPISKEAVHLAGYPWPGHTELLAEKFGAAEVAMMFAGGPFRVVLVTIHLALVEAIRSLTVKRILSAMRLADDALKRFFGIALPRLGVLGLNPHAGEAGRFGHEEREIIGPAIEEAKTAGICAFGPLPPDTAFHQAARGKFDLLVAMYHDQGLIALKTVAFDSSVNITLGLPTIRTSPDHGTAFDIAGRGIANPESMKQAIRLAVEMIRRGRAAARTAGRG